MTIIFNFSALPVALLGQSRQLANLPTAMEVMSFTHIVAVAEAAAAAALAPQQVLRLVVVVVLAAIVLMALSLFLL